MKRIIFIKSLLDRLNLRERVLFCAILLVLTIWWFMETISGVGQSINDTKVSGITLNNQQLWLDKEADYDIRMKAVLSKMESDKTFSGNQLLEVMDRISREVDLKTTISRPTTRVGEVFTEHVLVVPVARATMRTMIDFENKVKEHYPYLGIDYMSLEPQPSAPNLLRGEIRVTSFELNQS